MVIRCADGVERRVYPRFFTYSADYPEKCVLAALVFFLSVLNLVSRVLLATIRDKGLCPCPRCLTPKAKLNLMGRHYDSVLRKTLRTYMGNLVSMARSFIYNKALPITGVAVEEVLKPRSLVPTLVRLPPDTCEFPPELTKPLQNAFCERLGNGVNMSRMLVVDFMHEFELGVWRTLFTHTVRVLHAASSSQSQLVAELDRW